MFKFSSVQEGQLLISKRDSFLERLTPLEYTLIMGVNYNISECVFIKHLKSCILSWNAQEISRIRQVLSTVENIIKKLRITVQEEIVLVKTSGKDGWNSAYTRLNAIFLPTRKIESYTQEKLLKFLLHEYFHIFFRFREDLQKQLYQVIGFKIMKELKLPKILLNRKITNPDAPFINRYIKVEYQGKIINAIPIALLKEDFTNINTSKDILESIEFKFLFVQDERNEWKTKQNFSNVLVIDIANIKGFFEKVGNNTSSIIDPDEILAENFVFFALNKRNIPSVDVLDRIGEVINKRGEVRIKK